MGAQTSAILKGFDYQHLISWYHILSLKKTDEAYKVKLENGQAAYVDDLTVYKSDGTIDFYQIKYHVNTGSYSMENLLNSTDGASLMEKFWVTWKLLTKTYPKDKIKLILYSNWVHHPDDKILTCISGENGLLDDTFFNSGKRSACGKQREEWKKRHGASDEEFLDFTRSISFHFGRNFTEELKKMIAERMELLKLKFDDNALLIASGIVKEWIKEKTEDITPKLLEDRITKHDLLLPTSAEKSASVYFVTVKDHKFDLPPDYILDWRKHFKIISEKGDHELIDSDNWNRSLLPELKQLESKINNDSGATLIRARGFARLSPWFAFGFTFSEVSGYQIEVNQQNNLWRTDTKAQTNFSLNTDNGHGDIFSDNTRTVAVGISVTGSLESDVRKYVNEQEQVDALLLLSPANGPGRDALKSNSDVIALAAQSKILIRDFVKSHRAEKLLLFYFGPLSGACFIGHQLNAVCNSIQIMENTSTGSYIPSFLLH